MVRRYSLHMREETRQSLSKDRRSRGPVDILILMGAVVNVLVIAFFLFLYFRG